MAVIKVKRPKLSFGEKIYFGALIKGEADRWTPVVRKLGIKVD